LAKLRERGPRDLWLGLASPRRQNNAPVSRRKPIALMTRILCQRLHVISLYQDTAEEKQAAKKTGILCSTRFATPLYKKKA
jgi:hypothetical protein